MLSHQYWSIFTILCSRVTSPFLLLDMIMLMLACQGEGSRSPSPSTRSTAFNSTTGNSPASGRAASPAAATAKATIGASAIPASSTGGTAAAGAGANQSAAAGNRKMDVLAARRSLSNTSLSAVNRSYSNYGIGDDDASTSYLAASPAGPIAARSLAGSSSTLISTATPGPAPAPVVPPAAVRWKIFVLIFFEHSAASTVFLDPNIAATNQSWAFSYSYVTQTNLKLIFLSITVDLTPDTCTLSGLPVASFQNSFLTEASALTLPLLVWPSLRSHLFLLPCCSTPSLCIMASHLRGGFTIDIIVLQIRIFNIHLLEYSSLVRMMNSKRTTLFTSPLLWRISPRLPHPVAARRLRLRQAQLRKRVEARNPPAEEILQHRLPPAALQVVTRPTEDDRLRLSLNNSVKGNNQWKQDILPTMNSISRPWLLAVSIASLIFYKTVFILYCQCPLNTTRSGWHP